jgi:hypothetical protein
MNNILNLSTSVYKIVKENLSIQKENNGKLANHESITLVKNTNGKGSNKVLKTSTHSNFYQCSNNQTNMSYNSKIKD